MACPPPLPHEEAALRIADPDNVLAKNDVVLVGEMHGTEESPRFVLAAAWLALKEGRHVTVALEIPHTEDSLLQEYLSSTGPDEPAPAFVTGPFWQATDKDGRSSKAMCGLIVELRRFRRAGYPIHLAAIDPSDTRAGGAGKILNGGVRDGAMAGILATAIDEAPHDFFLVLTGNLHNRLERGVPWDSRYEPMGYVLAQRLPAGKRITALDVRYYNGGQAWICTPVAACTSSNCGESVCRVYDLPRTTKGPAREEAPIGVTLQDAVGPNRFRGYYYFQSAVRASEPAVARPSSGDSPGSSSPTTASRSPSSLGGSPLP